MTEHIKNFGRESLGKSASRIAAQVMRFAAHVGRVLVYIDGEQDVWAVWSGAPYAERLMVKHTDWCLGVWTAAHHWDKETARDIADHIAAERLARLAKKHRRAA